MAPIAWLLSPDDARLRDPDGRRQPRRRALRRDEPAPLIILTMSLCRPARRAGRSDRDPGVQPSLPPSSARRSASTRIAVALLGRSHPFGIVLAALLLRCDARRRATDADRGRHPGRDHRRHPGDDPAVPRRRGGDPARVPDPCGTGTPATSDELQTVSRSYAARAAPDGPISSTTSRSSGSSSRSSAT